jgi:thymidylate synthase (FAD)
MIQPGHTIPVLDEYGFVRYIDHLGSDQRIVESARISYKSPSKGPEQDRKLLEYLYKNLHTSPFEQCSVTLNIKLPILVMRQIVRHRAASTNEVSARYTELPDQFYIPKHYRKQDTKNKQGSVSTNDIDHEDMRKLVRESCAASYYTYQKLLANGVAREMARMVLPVNIYTEIYWTMNLRNCLHFLTLRLDEHAQWETRQYAEAIYVILKGLFPWTIDAFNRYQHRMVDTSKDKELPL